MVEEDIRKVKYKLAKLDDEDVQRRLALRRVDADSIRAADWVKQNQHKLKRKVWGPVVMEVCVSVKNSRIGVSISLPQPLF